MASLLQGSCSSSTRSAVHSLGVSSDGVTSRSISFSSQFHSLCFRYESPFSIFFFLSVSRVQFLAKKCDYGIILSLRRLISRRIHSSGANILVFLLYPYFSFVCEFHLRYFNGSQPSVMILVECIIDSWELKFRYFTVNFP